jgi:general L-amino acid transport system substrate-binding protein
MRRLRRVLPLLTLAGVVALTSATALAGEVLAGVKARGVLRCGVSEGIPGFSQQDATGRWQGLDADFCRAVAAAVLGDGERVKFVPLKSSTRFPALQARRIDLLARNATWTLVREAVLQVRFPAILFYDGQAFMVPAGAGIDTPAELGNATVCVEKGTTHERNLRRYAAQRGLSLTPLVIDSATEVAAAFFAGRCAAYSSDASQLAAARTTAPGGPDRYVILPERISKEPLAPVVWGGDPEWATVVRWVLFVLVLAEEEGITRTNLESRLAAGAGQLAWLSQQEEDGGLLAQSLGLDPGWGARAVKAVGNYGEVYARNLGAESPLRIDRGLNRLWTEGGLLYAPPVD